MEVGEGDVGAGDMEGAGMRAGSEFGGLPAQLAKATLSVAAMTKPSAAERVMSRRVVA